MSFPSRAAISFGSPPRPHLCCALTSSATGLLSSRAVARLNPPWVSSPEPSPRPHLLCHGPAQQPSRRLPESAVGQQPFEAPLPPQVIFNSSAVCSCSYTAVNMPCCPESHRPTPQQITSSPAALASTRIGPVQPRRSSARPPPVCVPGSNCATPRQGPPFGGLPLLLLHIDNHSSSSRSHEAHGLHHGSSPAYKSLCSRARIKVRHAGLDGSKGVTTHTLLH